MFDQRANGYSRGEGVGTLIVKPLSEALQANDPIHAIIRNTKMNQDGRTPGITMPSQEAQRSLIQATYQEAGLNPSETGFFEAHGTGTQVGDRVEAEALSSGLGTGSRSMQDLLHVGSIKTLLGHTEGCSGVAGVMHAAMALKNKSILPNCNFEIPNDKIDFDLWKIKVSELGIRKPGKVNLCRYQQNSRFGTPTILAGPRSIVLAMVVRMFMSYWKNLQSILSID